jgi:hypothetical protein
MAIHPLAEKIGHDLGMTTEEMEAELVSLSKSIKYPSLLLGGFNADVIAVAVTAVMRLERTDDPLDDSEDLMHLDRVRYLASEALRVCFQGGPQGER